MSAVRWGSKQGEGRQRLPVAGAGKKGEGGSLLGFLQKASASFSTRGKEEGTEKRKEEFPARSSGEKCSLLR